MRLISAAKHAALQTRYDRTAARLETLEESQRKEKGALSRVAGQYDDLKELVARHVTATGNDALRQAVAEAGLDLRIEFERCAKTSQPLAVRQFTANEAQLRAELHRTRKAYAAIEEHCRALQASNEEQARQLLDHATAVEGSAS